MVCAFRLTLEAARVVRRRGCGCRDDQALDVPVHLRIDRELDQLLRQRAKDEQIPISALVRRLLRQAIQQGSAVLSPAEVEDIARRVTREELESH